MFNVFTTLVYTVSYKIDEVHGTIITLLWWEHYFPLIVSLFYFPESLIASQSLQAPSGAAATHYSARSCA